MRVPHLFRSRYEFCLQLSFVAPTCAQLLLHRRVDFLTRARKVPAPLRLRLDSMQLPLSRSNSSLLRVGSALRLASALLLLLPRLVASALLLPLPRPVALGHLLPLLRLVGSVLEPAEVRIRAASSAAESSEHAGLLVEQSSFKYGTEIET